jgi:hypothetical protein
MSSDDATSPFDRIAEQSLDSLTGRVSADPARSRATRTHPR